MILFFCIIFFCSYCAGKVRLRFSDVKYNNNGTIVLDRQWQPIIGVVCTNYYGKLSTETPYKNGKEEGIAKEYYENGRLLSEIIYKSGKAKRVAKTYDENGRLKEEAPYENRKPEDYYYMGVNTYLNKNYAMALKYVEMSCNGGYMWGCINLATLYMEGEGIQHDLIKAKNLFKKACDGGEESACVDYIRLKRILE